MKKKSIFSISFIILTILTCISCGYLFSSMLLSTSIFASTITSEKQSIYLISMANSQTEAELENLKQDLQRQNGGGVIFKNDKKYYLIASAYENSTDADKVQKNLSKQNIQSEIISIDFPVEKIEGNFSNDEKNILQTALRCKFDIFRSLYDISISIDTQVFDIKRAKLECSNVFSKLLETKTNLESFFKNSTPEIVSLQTSLTNFYEYLNDLVNENLDTNNQAFSSLIKMTYLKILFN